MNRAGGGMARAVRGDCRAGEEPDHEGRHGGHARETMIQPVTFRAVDWKRLAMRRPIPQPTAAWVDGNQTGDFDLGTCTGHKFSGLE